MSDNKLYEGSPLQTVVEGVGNFWDTLTSSPVSDSVKEETAALAARQGITLPQKTVAPTQMPPGTPQIPGLQAQLPVVPTQAPNVMPTETGEFAQAPVQSGAPEVDPMADIMNQQTGLINKQKQINTSLAEAGANKAKYDAEKQREMARQAERDMAIQQVKNAERQNEVQGWLEDIQRTQSDYQKFLSSPEAKVKTNNMWENMGTGQKILAGISLALGAAGAAVNGKNTAVDVITDAINRDIDAQKTNIKLQAEGKLQNYNMANNLYAQMLKKYQNEDMAEAAVRLLRNQQVQMQLNAVASDYQGTQVKKQAEMANVQLDQANLQLKQQFAAAAQQNAMLRGAMDGDKINPHLLPKELRESYVPGYGIATSKENAAEFQKKRAESEPAINGLERVLAATKDFNRLDMTKRTQISTELASLIGQLRVPLTGPGAFTDKEYDRVAKTIGDPTAFAAIPAWERLKIQTVLNKFKMDLDNSADQYGLPRKNKQLRLKTLAKPE